ncbi:maleate cis-trans isomerase family protein [Leptolyngbya ohadii]|uniref:maleate cis-trans isomerase family protein n=1 Tax=Leptolyngbya ohadii TaxID=1962290 RepID=UPI000B59D162|nr:aspartate/glutamate racemase family protein [Leptolyngbya ohadii]
MVQPIRLGMLTPSSNTALEPIVCEMVGGLPEVSAHFSRFRVTEIALSDKALGQFNDEPILEAALLLADAKVDVIAWNGTSAGWLGFEADRHLCDRIQAATGIPATTSVLALNEIFQRRGIRQFGLVTPYRGNVQEKIIWNYRQAGFDCVAEQHLDRQVNFSFAEVTPAEIQSMVRTVATAKPEAITTFCTNLKAAGVVDTLEQEIQIPIYDTVTVAVWKSLTIAGVDPARVQGWGSLFQDDSLVMTEMQSV